MELRRRYKEPLAWRSASLVTDQIDSEESLDKSLGRYSTKQTGQKCNSKPVNARESMLTNGFAIVGSDIEPFGRLSHTTVADKRWLHRLSLQLYARRSVTSKSYQFVHRLTAWSCRLPEWTAARAPLQHCRLSNRENSRQRPPDRGGSKILASHGSYCLGGNFPASIMRVLRLLPYSRLGSSEAGNRHTIGRAAYVI